METSKDRWFNLNGTLRKNPTEEEFKDLEPNQIVEYIKGIQEGIIVETWYVGSISENNLIEFAYQPALLDVTGVSLSFLRECHFKRHRVDGKVYFEKSYTLPPSYFTENTVKIPRYR